MYSLLRQKAAFHENGLIQFAFNMVSAPASNGFENDFVGEISSFEHGFTWLR